jgi:hypothetical protein
MAKHHKWEGNVLTYNIPSAGTATLDVSKLPENVKTAAILFGIQTAARNATAGLFGDEPQTALKRMQKRFEAWLAGEWKAAGAGEGERKTSMLAIAVAQVGQITPEEAAQIISDTIEAKIAEAGLDSNDEEDKPGIRKLAQAVRDAFAEAEGVPVVLADLKAKAAQERAQAAAEAAKAADRKPGVALADLLKK